MLNQGLVSKSSSPWVFSVVLVKKKWGEYRFCVNYRRLNAVTKGDSYPLLRISDILTQTGNSSWFSSLDLLSAYWQVPLRAEDRPKTAFISNDGSYQFNRMAMGLKNSGATF